FIDKIKNFQIEHNFFSILCLNCSNKNYFKTNHLFVDCDNSNFETSRIFLRLITSIKYLNRSIQPVQDAEFPNCSAAV
ncbi:hypothetical protein BpHYR1_031656, partial [Brachionus plicatilis]